MRISVKADASSPQSSNSSRDALIKQLTEAASKLGLVVGMPEGKPKYAADNMVLGVPKMAASGIASFVNYPGGREALQRKAGEGLEAVKQEILASCPESDKELMNYILNEPAGSRKQKYQNGWMCDCEEAMVLVDDPLTLEGGIVVEKGVKGKVLEIAKDGDTWPGPPAWGGARIDFGGTIGEQYVSKDQFQNLVGVVLASRQIADPAAPGGKRGMLFKDFCEHEVAKARGLTPAMVFVLRFYTTWGFANINSPLRDPDLQGQKTSHKLAATVYLLDMAIRQSRAVAADSPEANVPLSLFRGIGKREMPDEFKTAGGTELAPMSTVRKFCTILSVTLMSAHACHCRITEFPHRRHWSTCGTDVFFLVFLRLVQTANLWVALKYSQEGDSSVLLWLRTQTFMDRGVDLTWISAFPHEREFLFSPLTYMQSVRDEPVIVKIGGVTYQVFEVKVSM